MTVPRFLFLALIVILALPWLTLETARVIAPNAQGAYSVQTMSLTTSTPATRNYRAPQDIGDARSLTMAKFGPFGPQVTRTYYSLGATSGPTRPAIVLLHGAGRDGRSMLDMWKSLAKHKDVILLAPNARRARGWGLIEDGAFVAKDLLDDARRHHPIDPDRIYIAGHSMGGKFALRLANFGLGPWQAVSIHAASLWPNSIWPAGRHIPIQMFTGAQDQVFKSTSVQSTGQRLSQAGHDVRVFEIPRHSHWYYGIGPQLASRAWAFFETARPRS
ncbi:dienelactone hydrolase family protein [Tropicibacter sp. R15_0]|uniref:alpha/beta fold hydrolase n=1 Tax=Tropicibacter sp. R15_0 TaxID=2821101 RepID=UPI001ADA081A|nr:alpha/beta fold hydrolase [Tropicibacter sp. R15_0]MBO9465592.1 dienelactone hydrolase family protein [Tropicibacter sp. R15_0]